MSGISLRGEAVSKVAGQVRIVLMINYESKYSGYPKGLTERLGNRVNISTGRTWSEVERRKEEKTGAAPHVR